MVWYADTVVMNHIVLWCASGCESWFAMLSQWLWIMLWYTEPVGTKHYVLFWACDCESCWVMLNQWLWIMVCYAESLVVNHGELCWTSECESCWDMLSQWLLIMLYYAEPVFVKHVVYLRANGYESVWATKSTAKHETRSILFIRESSKNTEIPDETINISNASWRDSSKQQLQFCSKKQINSFKANVRNVLSLLTDLFISGLG